MAPVKKRSDNELNSISSANRTILMPASSPAGPDEGLPLEALREKNCIKNECITLPPHDALWHECV